MVLKQKMTSKAGVSYMRVIQKVTNVPQFRPNILTLNE